MCAFLPYMSKICLLFMRLPWLACTIYRPFLTVFWFPFSLWLALLRDWALLDDGLCFSSTYPFSSCPLLPYYSIIPVVKLFASILLDLFGPAVYSSPNGPVRLLVLLLHHWRALVSHLFSLGCPGPVFFPWASSTLFLNFAFLWAFTNFFGASLAQLHYPSSLGFIGLPLILYFLCFRYFGSAVAYSRFFTSYTAHGLLFLSFWAPLSPFTSSRPICLSHGFVIHYSCRLGLMCFLSICQLFSVRVAGLLLPTWASKVAINREF